MTAIWYGDDQYISYSVGDRCALEFFNRNYPTLKINKIFSTLK